MPIPLGSLFTLVGVLRLDTTGMTSGLRRTFYATNAMGRAFGGMNNSLRSLQTQLALTATVSALAFGAAGASFARFEKVVTRAALAKGGAAGARDAFQGMADESFRLSHSFKIGAVDAAKLVQQVEELGVESDMARNALTRAGASLNTIADVEADEATKALFRLIRVTTRTGEVFEENLANQAEATAGAILRLGQQTATGVEGLDQFLRKFGQVGVVAQFSRGEVLALGAALADLDDEARERGTTAFFQFFQKVAPENARTLARTLKLSSQTFEELRTERPFELVTRVLQHLRDVGPAGLASEMERLGFVARRDARIWTALVANFERLYGSRPDDPLALINMATDDTANFNELNDQAAIALATLSKRWDGLVGAVERFGISAGSLLATVLTPLIGGLTGLADALERNRLLLFALLAGGGALGLRSARGFLGPFLAGSATAKGIGRNAGLAGRLAGGGVSGRFAGLTGGLIGLAGPGAARLLGFAGTQSLVRALGPRALVGGGIGLAIGALGLLAPMFGGIADALRDVSRNGGAAGIILKGVAVFFKLLEIAGNALNRVFEGVVKLFTDFLGLPVIRDLVKGINVGEEGLLASLEGVNRAVQGGPQVNISVAVPNASVAQEAQISSIRRVVPRAATFKAPRPAGGG